MRKKVVAFIFVSCFYFINGPLAFAQVQDMHLSLEQFKKINKANEDIKKIKKGITKEEEVLKYFGKELAADFSLEEPITKDDRSVFIEFLKNFVPDKLKPESYSFPNIDQKVLIYVFPWLFEHPVPCSAKKGECEQAENLVIVITINKKTGIVEEFKPFDFYFQKELKKK